MTCRCSRAALLLLALAALAPAQEIRVTPVQPGQPLQLQRKQASNEAIMAERARRAEQSGDYGRALSLWREVLTRSPWHAEALHGTARTLLVQKQYDEAEAFLNDYLARSEYRTEIVGPGDGTSRLTLSLLLGQVAMARGDEARAWSLWNDALAQAGRGPDAVRTMVMFLQQNRRWEDSEKLIRDYRKESKQPAFMALELAASLKSQMNFSAAATELLVYTQSLPAGWQLALNQLNQFPDDSAVAAKVSAVLEKAVKADRKNAALWRLQAGYALKTGEFETALRAATIGDSLSEAGGSQLLPAAEQIMNEGDLATARRGFERVLAWKPNPEVAARAELGLGRCAEIQGHWADAKQAYASFIERYPRAREADEARFRIGDILLREEGNTAEALQTFTGLLERGHGVPRAQVALRIGDCHAFMSDFAAAVEAWSQVTRPGGGTTEDQGQALLRMARAYLWQDSAAIATALLDSITQMNPGNTAFNDAVLYAALIGDGGYYRAVRAFAEADYASFRSNDAEAAQKYDEAANLLKSGRLAEWARYAQAVALREAGQPQAAIAVLDTFVAHYPESVDLDRAQYTRAVIRMEDLHDEQAALTEFQQFLAAHPRSIYLEQARRRARLLQANTL